MMLATVPRTIHPTRRRRALGSRRARRKERLRPQQKKKKNGGIAVLLDPAGARRMEGTHQGRRGLLLVSKRLGLAEAPGPDGQETWEAGRTF